jgi:hypothetical protein
MSVAPGTRWDPTRSSRQSALGDVCRARDTPLGRDVAIKDPLEQTTHGSANKTEGPSLLCYCTDTVITDGELFEPTVITMVCVPDGMLVGTTAFTCSTPDTRLGASPE